MNLVEELKPHLKHLKTWKESGKVVHGEDREALINIYEAYVKDNPRVGPAKIKRSCGMCLSDMMKALYNNYEEQKHKATVPFKGVPEIDPRPLEVMVETNIKSFLLSIKDLSKEAQIEHLKHELDERGVKYHHKAGVKKLTELLNG